MTIITSADLPPWFPSWLKPDPDFIYPTTSSFGELYPEWDSKLKAIYDQVHMSGNAIDRWIAYSLLSQIFAKLNIWIAKVDSTEDFNTFCLQIAAYKTMLDLYSLDDSWWSKIGADEILKPANFLSLVGSLDPTGMGTGIVDTNVTPYDLPALRAVANALDTEPTTYGDKKKEAMDGITDLLLKHAMRSMFEDVEPNPVTPPTKTEMAQIIFKDKKWKAAKELYNLKLEIPSYVT